VSLLGRALAVHPSNPDGWLTRAFGGFASLTGLAVTADGAESVAAVFAAVRILSETVASLPIHLYQHLDEGGKERAITHPLYQVLRFRPNPWQTPFEFWEMLVGHTALRGNGYAQKLYRNDGQIDSLIPLHPDRLRARMEGDVPVFDYFPLNGAQRTFAFDDLFRLTTHSADGFTGRSPVAIAREAIGLAMATERFGARFFSNMARPGGILTHPGKLSKEARERLKKQWQEQYASVENAHGVAVLEEGLTWSAVGMNLVDAQFLEGRKFQLQEVARMYRIPPHMMGELDRATFSNIEQQALEFVAYTLTPWLVRIEQAIWRDLFTATDQGRGYFSEFLVDALLRGDLLSRYQAYAIARNWGWFCVDDIRGKENLNPLPGGQGQIYLEPINMRELGQESPVPPPAKPGAPPPRPAPPAPGGGQQALAALLRDPLHRLARAEAHLVRDSFRRAGAAGILEAAYSGHADSMMRTLGPIVEPGAALVAGGALVPDAPELLRRCVARFAEEYVARARAGWSGQPALTAGAVDALLARLEADMPDRLAGELAGQMVRLITGAALLAPAA